MDCEDVRGEIRELRRGGLDAEERSAALRHLEGCPECRRFESAEVVLDELLELKLPRYPAPPGLRRRVESAVARGTEAPRTEVPRHLRLQGWARIVGPALAASLALVVGGVVVGQRTSEATLAISRLTSEAVNDHLRVLAGEHPLDVEAGGQHQVKPWFQGRLDFSPAVPAGEGTSLELQGGSVGYFLDQKAAVLSYRLRLHRVTLLAFRAGGLSWPADDLELGPVRGRSDAVRGFNVVMWRAGELGYALVSDVPAAELAQLAAVLAPATAR